MRIAILVLIAAAAFAQDKSKPDPPANGQAIAAGHRQDGKQPDAAEVPDYAKDLAALSQRWIECDESKDAAERAKRPGGDALNAARKKVWQSFIARADFTPIKEADAVSMKRDKDEAYQLNQWMKDVHKDYGCVAGGMGPYLYALYKNAPWVLTMCCDPTPREAKNQADDVVRSWSAAHPQPKGAR